MQITTVPTAVTGRDSRVVYRRPSFEAYSSDSWKERDSDEFEYTVNDGKEEESLAGKVTLVSDLTSRQLVSSDFRFNDENWKTVGNKVKSSNAVKHEATRRGEMNHYI